MKQILLFAVVLVSAFVIYGLFKKHSRVTTSSILENGFNLSVKNVPACDFGELEAIAVDEAHGATGEILITVESLGPVVNRPLFSKQTNLDELKRGVVNHVAPITTLFEPLGFFVCRDSNHLGACRSKDTFALTDFAVKTVKNPKGAASAAPPADHVYFFQPIRIEGKNLIALDAENAAEFFGVDRTLAETLEPVKKITSTVKSLPLAIQADAITLSLAGRDAGHCPAGVKWRPGPAASNDWRCGVGIGRYLCLQIFER
jgi:hypothetical protein